MGVEAAQEIADEIRTTFRARVVHMEEILEQIKVKLKADMLAQPAGSGYAYAPPVDQP